RRDHSVAPQVVLLSRAVKVVQAQAVVAGQDHGHLARIGRGTGRRLRQIHVRAAGQGEVTAQLQVEGEVVLGVGAAVLLVDVGAPTPIEGHGEGVGRAGDRRVLHAQAGEASGAAELVGARAGDQASRALVVETVAKGRPTRRGHGGGRRGGRGHGGGRRGGRGHGGGRRGGRGRGRERRRRRGDRN